MAVSMRKSSGTCCQAPIVVHVISHAPTKIQFPTREDGGLRDPDPTRRARRLDAAGVAVRRSGVMRYEVLRGGSAVATKRTRQGAEIVAHTVAEDPRHAARARSTARPGDSVAGWHLRSAR